MQNGPRALGARKGRLGGTNAGSHVCRSHRSTDPLTNCTKNRLHLSAQHIRRVFGASCAERSVRAFRYNRRRSAFGFCCDGDLQDSIPWRAGEGPGGRRATQVYPDHRRAIGKGAARPLSHLLQSATLFATAALAFGGMMPS
jgi:hypothetical protein